MARFLGVLVLCGAVLYGVMAITAPWAFHIGGRWTPLLYWTGSGNLVTKHGTYPLYVSIYPSSHFSRLHLDGLRPTGGVKGTGWLCTSPGVTQYLDLTGTIYGGWQSTESSLMGVRILEHQTFSTGQSRGYVDLYGHWQGPELVMNDRGHPSSPFRSGLKIENASVTLKWTSYSDFKAKCTTAKKIEID